jgi:excisionase family DNA binding protein
MDSPVDILPFEPFIGPNEAASFLSCTPRYLLRMARNREIPAHPLRRGSRNQWRFLRSELSSHMRNQAGAVQGKIVHGSPSRTRQEGLR